MKLRAALVAVMLLCVHFGFAQSLGRYQTCQLQTAQGQAVSGAQVYFLTQPADTEALTPQAQVYASVGGGPVAQPLLTNGFGECSAYLAPGVYTVVYVSNATGTLVYPDQNVAVGGGTPTSTAFGAIASGTNTGSAMVVGSGASLTPSGSGVIAATAIDGVTVSGTPSTGQAIVATSPTAASWQTVSSSGSTTPAQQFDIPYYSASGTASTLAGAAVNGIVRGRSTGQPVAASSIDVATVLQGAANCTTAGDVYSPQSNTCVSAGSLAAPGANGDLLYNNAGVVGASAVTMDGAGDIVQPNTAMLNHVVQISDTSAELGAAVAAAYAELPSCTDANGFVFTHCGTIFVSPGTYTWSTQQMFQSPYVGLSTENVTVRYTGTSTTARMLTIQPSSYTYGTNTALIGGHGFNVLGNSTPGICGIYFVKEQAPKIVAGIENFTGIGSTAVLTFSGYTSGDTIVHNTERGYYYLSLANNYVGFFEAGADLPTSTSGYDDVVLKVTVFAGQIGWKFDYVNFSADNGSVDFICNVVDTGTCMDAPAGNAFYFGSHFTMEMEQTIGTGGTARHFPSPAKFSGTGYLVIGGGLADSVFNDTSCEWFSNAPDAPAKPVWICHQANFVTTDGVNTSTLGPSSFLQPNLATLNKETVITSSTDLTADLAAAFAASPSCSDSVGTYPHCPNIRVAPGAYNGHTPVTFDTPYMNIRMDGVHLNDTHTTTACLITLTDASDPSPQGSIRALDAFPYFGGKNFFLDGQGAATNSCGIKAVDIFSLTLEAGVNYYAGTGSAEVWQQDNTGATERSNFILQLQPFQGDGLRMSTTGVNPIPTTGYGQYIINCSSATGTCFHGSGVIFNQNGFFHLICNMNSGATCVKGDTGFIFDGVYSIRAEQDGTGPNANGRVFDSTTTWGGIGQYKSGNGVTEANFTPSNNSAIETTTLNDSVTNANVGSSATIANVATLSCSTPFCTYIVSRNAPANSGLFTVFPSGTISTSNPAWEIGEWQNENDLTLNCYNGSRVVCGRLTTAGAFSVPGDVQAATGHIGGSAAGNAICTQNGTNCPVSSAGFSAIASGTNTAAAMVVGTGANLTTSGSGSINATQLESRTWEMPGTIGTTTPNTAVFTTLSTIGSASLSANPGINGGVAHTFSNTWAAPSSNFATVVSEIAPNIAVGGNVQHLLGVSGAINNLLQQFFHYAGTGSSGNYVTSQFFGGNSLLALQAAGSVSVSNAAIPCFSQLFAVGSSCQFTVTSAGQMNAATGSTVNGSLICTAAGVTGCASGSPAFSVLASGTNTAASMVVGAGASLTTAGSGMLGTGPLGTATSSANFNSGSLIQSASYWTGTATGSDQFSAQVVEGAGANPTSTWTLSHTGSSRSALVSLPAFNNSMTIFCDTSGFCPSLISRNSVLNTAVFTVYPSGTLSSSNPIWEAGEWNGENDYTINCYDGSTRGVCARLTVAGSFSVPSDIQGNTVHAGGSSAGNLVCTANGVNCPTATHPHNNDAHIEPALFATSTMLGPVWREPLAGSGLVYVRTSGTISCTVAPIAQVMDLGTSPLTAYGSATAFSNVTTSTSDGIFPTGLVSAGTVTAGHFYGVAFSAGTCTTFPTIDVTMSVQ